MNNIAKNIVALRKKNNLSQDKFAKSVGLKRSTVASYEKVGKLPRMNTLILIAETYDVTLDELIRGEVKGGK